LSSSIPIHSRLAASIDRYVDGSAKSQLVRPFGEGSDPVWCRMRPPLSRVVGFRNWDTRTFGFFGCPDVFVGATVVLATEVKATKSYPQQGEAVANFLARVSPTEIDGGTDVERLVTDRDGRT
jgi:hypothetical protein